MVVRRTEGPEEPTTTTALALQAHDQAKREAERIPLQQALAWEQDREWPGWRLRRGFWNRPDIPEELRGDGPDPRAILALDDPEREQWSTEREQWLADRLRWLEEAASEVTK